MSRLDSLIPLIENKKNIFISGLGGVGKSYLLKQIFSHLNSTFLKDEVVLTSTTGVSAYGLGGTTIHSWSGVVLPNEMPKNPQIFITNLLRKIINNAKLFNRWKVVKCIIIDEISMCGSSYIDLLNIIAQEIKKNTLPFGGIQVIFGGDLLQLPPIKDDYCFESGTWPYLNINYIVLEKAYRFTDQSWIETLKRVRIGKLNKDDVKLFNNCLTTNKKLIENGKIIIKPTYISPLKKEADDMNRQEMDNIEEKEFVFKSNDECETYKRSCSYDECEIIDKYITTPSTLKLKLNCQVMLLVNLDIEGGLVNGSRGVVVDMNETSVTVKFKSSKYINNTRVIEYYSFQSIEHDNIKYSRSMIPLQVAFAVTTHKVQGSTIDCAVVNCGNTIFEDGQAYVTLSRVRNPEGLYITQFMLNKIRPNKKALDFETKAFKNATYIE